MRTAKYHVEVKTAGRALRVEQEIVESLKKSLSSKMISRMRREFVDCPVANREIPFLLCYNCVSFIRRVSGRVDCEGTEFSVKHQ